MLILVCETCRGSGTACPSSKPCETCKGSGYPPGYTPPSAEECRRYATQPFTCRSCGKAQDIDGLLLYYRAAHAESSTDKKAEMALELCHSLILAISNHEFCMHGKARRDP